MWGFYPLIISFSVLLSSANFASELRSSTIHHNESSKMAICKAALYLARSAKHQLVDIFGAGGCNEIPLGELAQIFETARLVDINTKPCEQAVAELDETSQAKIQLIHCDLSYNLIQFVKEHKEEILSSFAAELFAQRECKTYELSTTKKVFDTYFAAIPETPINGHKPDFLVSSLVLSQILGYSAGPMLGILTKSSSLGMHMKHACGEHEPRFPVNAVMDALYNLFNDVITEAYARSLTSSHATAIYFADTIPARAKDKPNLEAVMVEKIRQLLSSPHSDYRLVIGHCEQWPYSYLGDQEMKHGEVQAMVFWRRDFFSHTHFCAQCGGSLPTIKRCGKCKAIRYCSADCQRIHWPFHKADCVAPRS